MIKRTFLKSNKLRRGKKLRALEPKKFYKEKLKEKYFMMKNSNLNGEKILKY